MKSHETTPSNVDHVIPQSTLNPAQQKVIDLLGVPQHERPKFDRDLGNRLHTELEECLKPLAETIDSIESSRGNLYFNKHRLGRVLECEHCYMIEQSKPFRWSPALARGTVSHKAIELTVNWPRKPDPLDLVDEAIARLADSNQSIGEYLRSCPDVERAELVAEANQLVVKFLESFPPLKRAWTPVTESSLRATLLGDRIVLNGKPDLILGRTEGNVASKVIIDFKSGGSFPTHIEDLRFYALLDTLRLGIPPRMLATYYLDSGDLHPEPMTVDLLFHTTNRVVAGVTRYVEIVSAQRDPVTAPPGTCYSCAAHSQSD